MSKICTGYLVLEPSDDAGRRCLEKGGRSILLVGMPAAHETGLPITTVRPYQSRNDSAGTAHLSYGSSKRSDSGAGGEHTAVTVDAIGLTTHKGIRMPLARQPASNSIGARPTPFIKTASAATQQRINEVLGAEGMVMRRAAGPFLACWGA